MAHFLRDTQIRSVTLTEDNVRELCEVFMRRTRQPSNIGDGQDELKTANFVIRFDNRGYKLYSADEVISYWRSASKIERIVLAVESGESIRTNRHSGSFLELRLDPNDDNSCTLISSSDNRDWMDGSFWAVEDCLKNCKNRYGLIRNKWTPLFIEGVGTLLVLALSLWQAVKLAPLLNVGSPEIIGFILLFFFYLPFWKFLHAAALRVTGSLAPNVKFFKQNRSVHWFGQLLIGIFVTGAIGLAGTGLVNLAGQLIKLSS